ncbi:MAG: hypothetical protein IT577_23840 [Verrucomicrobiae bacterium]|nr:hypothetical protein [Verrucomicrobiae bacterium]
MKNAQQFNTTPSYAASIQPAAPGNWTTARRHADEAVSLGRRAAHHAILCGIELLRLRAGYPETRGNPALQPKTANIAVIGSWASAVEEELGIPERTARLWMSAAKRQLPLVADAMAEPGEEGVIDAEVVLLADAEVLEPAVEKVTEGRTLEQLLLPLDADGKLDPDSLTPKKRKRYDRLKAAAEGGDARAAALLARVDDGKIDVGRAYAGWRGEGVREKLGHDERGGPTSEEMRDEKDRIFTDRMRQLWKGIMCEEQWRKIPPAMRLAIVTHATSQIVRWPEEIRTELAMALLDAGAEGGRKRRGRA